MGEIRNQSQNEVDAFLAKMGGGKAGPSAHRGRLIFALDATMSRQPTWDRACQLQAGMFQEAAAIGGLDVQLVYYRGLDECRASRWVFQTQQLGDLMVRIDCRAGHTQIQKVLAHTRRETQLAKVSALVFVGDAMEEKLGSLCDAAGELRRFSVPAFLFQEGEDPAAAAAFQQIARLTGGAHCRFDQGAAGQLGSLLRSVAAFAAGGMVALEDLSRRDVGAAKLLAQLTGGGGAG